MVQFATLTSINARSWRQGTTNMPELGPLRRKNSAVFSPKRQQKATKLIEDLGESQVSEPVCCEDLNVVEISFKKCHNSVWIMMSCWNPNRWFFFLVSKTHWITPCNNIPKKSLSCQSCAKLIFSGPSLSQERSTERHAVAFLTQHDKSGKVLFPPSRKLTYPTLKRKRIFKNADWEYVFSFEITLLSSSQGLQGSFLQVAPPPRANLPHLRCRYSLPQALQRWKFLGAGGPTNHWVARFSYTPWRFIRQYHVRPQHVQVSTDEHIKISPSEPSEVASCTNLVGFWRPYFWDDASLHVPMSKLPILGMVIPPLIGILVMGI